VNTLLRQLLLTVVALLAAAGFGLFLVALIRPELATAYPWVGLAVWCWLGAVIAGLVYTLYRLAEHDAVSSERRKNRRSRRWRQIEAQQQAGIDARSKVHSRESLTMAARHAHNDEPPLLNGNPRASTAAPKTWRAE